MCLWTQFSCHVSHALLWHMLCLHCWKVMLPIIGQVTIQKQFTKSHQIWCLLSCSTCLVALDFIPAAVFFRLLWWNFLLFSSFICRVSSDTSAECQVVFIDYVWKMLEPFLFFIRTKNEVAWISWCCILYSNTWSQKLCCWCQRREISLIFIMCKIIHVFMFPVQ